MLFVKARISRTFKLELIDAPPRPPDGG